MAPAGTCPITRNGIGLVLRKTLPSKGETIVTPTLRTATFTTAEPHQATAWQRFLPTGPVAFLPLAEAHAIIAVTPLLVTALAEQKELIAKRKPPKFDMGPALGIKLQQ